MPHLDKLYANVIVLDSKEVLLNSKADIYLVFYVVRDNISGLVYPYARVTFGPDRIEIGRTDIYSTAEDEEIDERKVYNFLAFMGGDIRGRFAVDDLVEEFEFLTDIRRDEARYAVRYNTHEPLMEEVSND